MLLKNKNVLLLLLIESLGSMIFYLPIGMMFKLSRGLSISQIFLIESISFVVSIVCEVPSGWLADKIGFKKAICLAVGFVAAARILVLFSYSFWAFVSVSTLTGIGYALLSGSDTSLMYVSVEQKDAEKAFSLMGAFVNGGVLISLAASSILLLFVPMTVTYILTAITMFAAFVLSLLLKDIPRAASAEKERRGLLQSLKDFLSNRKMIVLVLSQGLIAEIWRSIYQNLNQFQYIRCGIDVKYFGFLAVAVAIFPLFSGKAYALTAKFGQERLLKALFILIAAGLFALTLTSNAVLSIILIVLITAAYPLCQPALEEIQQRSITGINRATMMSIFALVMELAAAGENALVSSAAGVSLPLGFSSLGILAIIATLLMFVYYRMSRNAGASGLQGTASEAAQ